MEERRRAERLAVFGAVGIEGVSGADPLPLRDISDGGALVFAEPLIRRSFPIGSERTLLVSNQDDKGRPPVRLPARVVRHDHCGIAFQWVGDGSQALGAFLDRLRPRSQRVS